MNTAPFDTRAITERLQSQVTGLRQVAGAADYASIRSLADYPAPCAYVLLAREQDAEPHPPGHGERGSQVNTVQRLIVTFGVVLVVRNYREQRGSQLAGELDTFLGNCRNALLGFVPDVPGARPCRFRQGDLTEYDASTVLWTDVWQTQHTIGANA